MNYQSFKVHLILKMDKTNKKGLAPIFARIKTNGLKIEISTNRNLEPVYWSNEDELALTTFKTHKEINHYLESFRSKIYAAYNSVLSTGESISAELLKKALFGTPQKKKYTLIETATQHNELFEKLIGVKYSYGSYKNYKTTLKYLKEFIHIQYKSRDIPLEAVNYTFCEQFYMYLIEEKACHNNGANKQLQRVSKIINYAVRAGYISTNPMTSYSLTFNPTTRIALTMHELNKVENLIIQRKELEQVRDIFVFMCYTGLAYIDIKRLEAKDIQHGDKGEAWIKMERQKTKITFTVPLLKPAMKIMKSFITKTKSEGLLFPVLSNQKMNDALKLIQELAGINKNFSTHLGRHTFATTVTLNNDVPIETVSRMLGHTNIRTTQIYAKVLDNKIKSDMKKLKETFDL